MTNNHTIIIYPYQSLNKYQELICSGLELFNYRVLREKPSGLLRLVELTFRSNKAFFNVHWIDPIATEGSLLLRLLRVSVFMVCMYFFSINGRLVWTLHNDRPHDSEAGLIFLLLYRYMVNISTLIIVHSSHQEDALRKNTRRRRNVITISHPSYIGTDLDCSTEQSEYHPREFNGLHFLIFGLIRRYKGVDRLIEQLDEVTDKINLTIIGRCSDSSYSLLLSKLASTSRHNVRLFDREYSDQELLRLACNCDAAIIPYTQPTISGALTAALTMSLPVIVKRNSYLHEYLDPSFSFQYSETPAEIINNLSIDKSLLRGMSFKARSKAESLSPSRIAGSICDALNTLC